MALAVDRYELGPIGTNCYVVRASSAAQEAVVIDPGDDATEIKADLDGRGARVVGILITHTHFDHIGGVAGLAESTGAPVWIAETEAFVLERPDEIYAAYGVHIRPWEAEHRLAGEEAFELAGIAWQTVPVPGHSPGHLAFAGDGALFSGDVLFAGSVGRVDLPGGDWPTLLDSIRLLAERYPPETTVYPGHGPPTTLGEELASNPFLTELRAAR